MCAAYRGTSLPTYARGSILVRFRHAHARAGFRRYRQDLANGVAGCRLHMTPQSATRLPAWLRCSAVTSSAYAISTYVPQTNILFCLYSTC